MTDLEIRQAVLDAVGTIAPETPAASIAPDQPLRDQLDIDSFDFLRLLVRLNERLGVEVPEAEYGRLRTLDEIVAWFSARLAGRR